MMVRRGGDGQVEDCNDVDCKCNDGSSVDSFIVSRLCLNVEAGFEGFRCR